jgi:hypothetical protein
MVSQTLTASRLVAMCLLAFLMIGCRGTSKDFAPEDFKKIIKGMSEQQAHELLGPPGETIEAADVRRSFWKSADKYYSISFTDGKVVEPMQFRNSAIPQFRNSAMQPPRTCPSKRSCYLPDRVGK